MINLIISILIGAIAWAVSCVFWFDSVWTGILLFLPIFVVVFVILNRKVALKVSAIMNRVQTMTQNIPSLPTESARNNQINKMIDILKEAYAYRNYQFFLKQQVNSQIGSLLYMTKKFDEAEKYLKDSFLQPGTPRAMYACILYRRSEEQKMVQQFELAVKLDKKTPLLWNVYAWCLCQLKKRDEAIAVLNRCLTYCPSDQITKDNLDSLKNKAKMKMKPFELQWYQFWLEEPPRKMVMVNPMSKRSMFR